jgi:hypothetical protein
MEDAEDVEAGQTGGAGLTQAAADTPLRPGSADELTAEVERFLRDHRRED